MPSIINNFVQKIILDTSKFLKRDFFEIQFLKHEEQIKKFYSNTQNNISQKIMENLLSFNPYYGVIFKNEIIKQSSMNFYWIIEPIDDFANFTNNIIFWGTSITLKNDSNEAIYSSFYLPMIDEYFFAEKNYGLFLNNKKLNLTDNGKKIITHNVITKTDRNYGSDLLHMFYFCANKINLMKIKNTKENNLIASLIIKEVKSNFTIEKDFIKLGF